MSAFGFFHKLVARYPSDAGVETRPNLGLRVLLFLPNGYRTSILQSPTSYGGANGLYEMGLFTSQGNPISTPLFPNDGMEGWLTEEDVLDRLDKAVALTDEDVEKHLETLAVQEGYPDVLDALAVLEKDVGVRLDGVREALDQALSDG